VTLPFASARNFSIHSLSVSRVAAKRRSISSPFRRSVKAKGESLARCNLPTQLDYNAVDRFMSLTAGTKLGPYKIVSPLGAGGMGEVYRARDTRLEREVAVKVLPASLASDADRLRRFEQEARAVAALNHPNILAIYDIGSHQGSPYLVSELLEGETLRGRLGGGRCPNAR
jgi:serine/threonine protein kinase